ncbi:protein of unknown function [Candidatus Promineifilum breve]|uniref:Uncharacterized protein n=1 Tax=Candidatus Promineifilum breve TaxID=1806508 RepID=A0A160T489_9CHLR|nr:protein of unknown function [Candidatus Promineifilum breve]
MLPPLQKHRKPAALRCNHTNQRMAAVRLPDNGRANRRGRQTMILLKETGTIRCHPAPASGGKLNACD